MTLHLCPMGPDDFVLLQPPPFTRPPPSVSQTPEGSHMGGIICPFFTQGCSLCLMCKPCSKPMTLLQTQPWSLVGWEWGLSSLIPRHAKEAWHQQDMDAAEMDSLEMLRNVFDSMATNGKITMDQLPFVLVGAEVQSSLHFNLASLISDWPIPPGCQQASYLFWLQCVGFFASGLIHFR